MASKKTTVAAWLLLLVTGIGIGLYLYTCHADSGRTNTPHATPAGTSGLATTAQGVASGSPLPAAPATLPVAGAATSAPVPPPFCGAFTNRETRAAAVARWHHQSATRSDAARQQARSEGWPTRLFTADGSSELQAIRNGKLYYYATKNVNAAISTAVTPIRNTPPYNLSGAGLSVGVWDADAVRPTHQELAGRVVLHDTTTPHDHSTHVAGTIGASGVTPSALGMAPAVTIESYEWNNDIAEMASRAMAAPGTPGTIQISNHSYGQLSGWEYGSWSGFYGWHWFGTWGYRESDSFGAYDWTAAEWDRVCYEAPYYLPFTAAGNDRNDYAPGSGSTFYYWDGGWKAKTYNPSTDPYDDYWDGGYDTMLMTANAKNIMAVGAVNDAVSGTNRSLTAATMSDFSGWGPADDGRIKPDIVANGVYLYSCLAGSDTSYGYYSGTSMATPNAAGSAILLTEYFTRLFPGQYMLASTLKGLILHTADDLGRPGPDYTFGWGLMNAKVAADLIAEHHAYPGAGILHEAALSDTNAQQVYTLLWDHGRPLRATLCWTDPPADISSGLDNPSPRLLNDLDLRIIDSDGKTNFPFVLDPTKPDQSASTGDNVRDNVEQVLIPAPSSNGLYRVIVSAKTTLVNGTQVFSLWVSGATVAPAIEHVPLQNTTNTDQAYVVEATITPAALLDTNALLLVWSADPTTNACHTNVLAHITNDLYRSTIPAQPLGTVIGYYLQAGSTNGYSTTDPPGAPATKHQFAVVLPVELQVSGAPAAYDAVVPAYGTNAFPSGVVVTASAPLFTPPAGSLRQSCLGWAGTGDVPATGRSNTVAFVLQSPSSITWSWTNQFALTQTSGAAGAVNTTSWWDEASTGQTVVAPLTAARSGTNYAFVEWQLDGVRQPNATSPAANPVAGVAMTGAHVALAVYLPDAQDSDGDGLPDWWERRNFGSANAAPLDDPDVDGFSNLQEYQDATDPHSGASRPAPPAISHTPLADPQATPAPWTVVAGVTDNDRVASVALKWRRNGQFWNRTSMATGSVPDEYRGSIPAPGAFGDVFEYQIEADDGAGWTSTTGTFSFSVSYPVLGLGPPDFNRTVLLPGTWTNCTLAVTNSGNAGLTWNLSLEPAGFSDDMESGTNGWTHGGAGDLWTISSYRFASSNHAWYCGLDRAHEYQSGMNAWLLSPPVRVADQARLRFQQWMRAELDVGNHAWDGGIVEVSTNDGVSFAQITPDGGYPFLVVSNPASPFAAETPCFAGTGGWQNVEFDLGGYADREIRIRFRFGSDGYTVDEGWYLDDVAITPESGTESWLFASPTNGIVPPGATRDIAVTLDASLLQPGTDRGAVLSLSANDPSAIQTRIPASLFVRSVPQIAVLWAGQTSTNGSGRVSISNTVADAGGVACSVELLYSLDAGVTWTNATLQSATGSLGRVAFSNAVLPQVLTVATTNGFAVPATNRLVFTWSTTNSPVVPILVTNTLLRLRAWDGFLWSTAATSLPFLVDNAPPTGPAAVTSTSHFVSQWSTVRVVAAAWDAASDGAGSGVAGYGVVFTNRPPTDAPKSVTTASPSALSAALADGTNWWIAVRAIDVYGNASPSAFAGPYRIDATAPTATGAVVTIRRSAYGNYAVGPALSGSWTGFTDTLSGVAGYYVSVLNGQGTTNGTWTTASTATVFAASLDATNTLYIWARDQAGAIGAAAQAAALVLDPLGDGDGDGLSAADEEIAGTDARNAQSRFAIQSIEVVGSNVSATAVQWSGVSNRLYTLYATARLTNAPWAALPDAADLPGNAAAMVYTNVGASTNSLFYRLTVRSASP